MPRAKKTEIEQAVSDVLTKASLENRVQELKEAFEKESSDLEAYIKHCEASVAAKRTELTKMQGEYAGLTSLLSKYAW